MQLDSTSSPQDPDNKSGRLRLSRRQLLGAAGAAGAGLAGVWGLATVDWTPGDQTSIVYAMARTDPADEASFEPRTKHVPVEWFHQLKLAFDVQAELREAGLSSLVGSFVIPGDYDDPSASIAVDATDEGIRETLQALSPDIPFDLSILEALPPARKKEPELEDAAQIPDLDDKRVPSGYVCTANNWYGTLAPAIFDERKGTRVFATSNHLFGDNGMKETEHAGEPLSLIRGGVKRDVGRVVRGFPKADLVRVAPMDGYQPLPTIARTSPGTVIGQYTKLGLADLMARGEPLEKVGALSDHTTGTIKGIDGVTCYTSEICKPGQLKWGTERTIVDGDSGSVCYHADPEHPDEYVLIGGLNNARTWWPGMNFSWGTAAYHLRDRYGLHF